MAGLVAMASVLNKVGHHHGSLCVCVRAHVWAGEWVCACMHTCTVCRVVHLLCWPHCVYEALPSAFCMMIAIVT